jgi:hypothetical protein
MNIKKNLLSIDKFGYFPDDMDVILQNMGRAKGLPEYKALAREIENIRGLLLIEVGSGVACNYYSEFDWSHCTADMMHEFKNYTPDRIEELIEFIKENVR